MAHRSRFKSGVLAAGLLIIGLLAYPGPVLAGQSGQQVGGSATTSPYLLWLVVAGAGMFGGFLFGIFEFVVTTSVVPAPKRLKSSLRAKNIRQSIINGRAT